MRYFSTAVIACALSAFAVAAGAADDSAEKRQKQAELYAEMLTRPADPELMIAYARVSVELSDYEAAIATLERALIYEPDEPLTELELGVAYFRIGSYRIAEVHLNAARTHGLPPELDARAAQYQAEIARRTEVSQLSGVASFGLAYSSNANLGPKNDLISFFGVPAIIPSSATAQSDIGARAALSLRHTYDLGRSNSDALVTDLNLYSLHFFDETDGDVDVVSLTTGPNLALDNRAFGVKMRPFVNLGYARVGNDSLYSDYGVGAEFSRPVSDTLTTFARFDLNRRDFHNGFSEFDSVIFGGEIGASARTSPGAQINGSIFAAAEFTDDSDFDNQEFGLRSSFTYSYAPDIDMVDGLWTASAYARATRRYFDDAVPYIDPTRSRSDKEFRIGLGHLFRIQDGLGVRADVDYYNRDSNIPNFDLDNLTGALSVVYEF
ncbi:hypothetical protein [Pikeienuella sp. HZG-20]|uniref:hypothetical protein n=1 Tax=Paludibacillus litoralis TaxID=3133267 RepID=UPI0030EE6B6D